MSGRGAGGGAAALTAKPMKEEGQDHDLTMPTRMAKKKRKKKREARPPSSSSSSDEEDDSSSSVRAAALRGVQGEWDVSGTSADTGEAVSEYLLLAVEADGALAGRVDDGDGRFDDTDDEDGFDSSITGSIDLAKGALAFDQTFSDGIVTTWRAKYDPESDTMVRGRWSGDTTGAFTARRRSPEPEMPWWKDAARRTPEALPWILRDCIQLSAPPRTGRHSGKGSLSRTLSTMADPDILLVNMDADEEHIAVFSSDYNNLAPWRRSHDISGTDGGASAAAAPDLSEPMMAPSDRMITRAEARQLFVLTHSDISKLRKRRPDAFRRDRRGWKVRVDAVRDLAHSKHGGLEGLAHARESAEIDKCLAEQSREADLILYFILWPFLLPFAGLSSERQYELCKAKRGYGLLVPAALVAFAVAISTMVAFLPLLIAMVLVLALAAKGEQIIEAGCGAVNKACCERGRKANASSEAAEATRGYAQVGQDERESLTGNAGSTAAAPKKLPVRGERLRIMAGIPSSVSKDSKQDSIVRGIPVRWQVLDVPDVTAPCRTFQDGPGDDSFFWQCCQLCLATGRVLRFHWHPHEWAAWSHLGLYDLMTFIKRSRRIGDQAAAADQDEGEEPDDTASDIGDEAGGAAVSDATFPDSVLDAAIEYVRHSRDSDAFKIFHDADTNDGGSERVAAERDDNGLEVLIQFKWHSFGRQMQLKRLRLHVWTLVLFHMTTLSSAHSEQEGIALWEQAVLALTTIMLFFTLQTLARLVLVRGWGALYTTSSSSWLDILWVVGVRRRLFWSAPVFL